MNKKEKKSWWASWVSLLLLGLIVASCGAFIRLAERNEKREVKEEIHPSFPVLVIIPKADGSRYQADTVYYAEREEFLKKNQEYTFLVPPGQEEILNAQLAKAYFKVQQLAEERQLLEVFFTKDPEWINTGWDEATERNIVPKYHKSYSESRLLVGIVISTVFVWGVGYAVFLVGRYLYRTLAA